MSAATPECSAEHSATSQLIRLQPSRLAIRCHWLAAALAALAGLLSPLPSEAIAPWLALVLLFGILGWWQLRSVPCETWVLQSGRCFLLRSSGHRYPMQVWRAWHLGTWLQWLICLEPGGRRRGVLLWPDTTDGEGHRRLRATMAGRLQSGQQV